MNGLYTVNFRSPTGSGTGVVIVNGNSIQGGDSGYYYHGDISQKEGNTLASLEIVQHNREFSSVFGDFSRFTLKLSGTLEGPNGMFSGTIPESPKAIISIDLKKQL